MSIWESETAAQLCIQLCQRTKGRVPISEGVLPELCWEQCALSRVTAASIPHLGPDNDLVPAPGMLLCPVQPRDGDRQSSGMSWGQLLHSQCTSVALLGGPWNPRAVWGGRDLKAHPVPSCRGQGHVHYPRLPRRAPERARETQSCGDAALRGAGVYPSADIPRGGLGLCCHQRDEHLTRLGSWQHCPWQMSLGCEEEAWQEQPWIRVRIPIWEGLLWRISTVLGWLSQVRDKSLNRGDSWSSGMEVVPAGDLVSL